MELSKEKKVIVERHNKVVYDNGDTVVKVFNGSKPEYPWDKGCQEIEKYRMAILDDDVFFHIALMLSRSKSALF